MNAAHNLILGATGSGKTSLARMLVHGAPRVVVFDRSEDATWEGFGATFRDPGRAIDLLTTYAERDYQAVFRMPEREHDLILLGGIMKSLRTHDLPPIVVVHEEATFYSEARGAPPEVSDAIQRGRKEGLILVTLAQETTDISTTIRRQSFLTISLRQTEPVPRDVAAQFDASKLKSLETVTPFTEPVYGVHYLTDPVDTDPWETLRSAILAEPQQRLPEDWRPPRSI